MGDGFAHRFAAVADFGHHRPLGLFFENLPQPLSDDRVIVAKQ